jgi:ribulose-5-phosphate 4-epimerase/fuculose-1-phosphate aldolase
MEKLVKKYVDKLVKDNLCEKDQILLGGIDDIIFWNREDPLIEEMEIIIQGLNINSILLGKPKEPYFSIIKSLSKKYKTKIEPRDSETRTFLHDLPIVNSFNTDQIIEALKKRKCVIVPEYGIITFGHVTPEQAYVTFSSVCFSTFVKYFSDFLEDLKKRDVKEESLVEFEKITGFLNDYPEKIPDLEKSPFIDEEKIYEAISRAGYETVNYKLVDSYFGNVSFTQDGTIYISQTGSSLDNLDGFVDPVNLDGSSCAGITASSELSAHKKIVEISSHKAILHGHPKFSVIISMDCDNQVCDRNRCYTRCSEKRSVNDIPIVPGEVGTGVFGLCNTLPAAVKGKRGAIVYGHGVFTTGKDDFTEPFKNLLEIEKMCKLEYFERVENLKKEKLKIYE